MKARKVTTFYGKYSNIVVYEYRGEEYDVEYPTCSSYCCTKPRIQHEDAQRRIDEMLDSPQSNIDRSFDMDEIFEMLGWND